MTAPASIADFLLTFGAAEYAGSPQRCAPSAPPRCVTGPNWKLALFAVGDGWVGMPCETATRDHLRAWLFGELYTGSLAAILGQISANLDTPPDINGHALLLVRDDLAQQWHIWTDRFGTLHAYHTPGALGTFSPAVAALRPRSSFDLTGLAGFFLWGFFPVDRTHFENVRILPPASHTVLDENGRLLRQTRYWDWHFEPDPRRNFDNTVDQFAEVFHRVMRGAVAGRKVALPISGGLDSRSTVAALPDLSDFPSPWAYSYGYAQNSPETRIARQIAQARGLPFDAFTIPPYLFDRIHEITAAVEGFQDITQCRQAAFSRQIGAHADRVIAAHWGDVWFDQASAENTASTADLALKKISKPGGGWLAQNVILPHAPDAAKTANDLIRVHIAGYAQIDDSDFRLKAVKTDLWSARWTTASLRAYQGGAFPVLPFYDTRIADFFLTVPSEFLSGRALQIAYLKRFSPDLARITWQAYDANLYQYRNFNTWQLPKRAAKKLWRVFTGERVLQRNWEVQFLNPDGRSGLEKWLLSPNLRLHEFIPSTRLRSLLDEFYARPDNREKGYILSMLLTFSAWLENYGH